jgi:hypothetical protein
VGFIQNAVIKLASDEVTEHDFDDYMGGTPLLVSSRTEQTDVVAEPLRRTLSPNSSLHLQMSAFKEKLQSYIKK